MKRIDRLFNGLIFIAGSRIFSVLSRDFVAMSLPKTEEEWRLKLTPEQFKVLRQKGTERPGTGNFALNSYNSKEQKHYHFEL
jgi:hypothetical protein